MSAIQTSCTPECRYCGGATDCSEKEPNVPQFAFGCTRLVGHSGPHIACGSREDSHNLAIWDNHNDLISNFSTFIREETEYRELTIDL